MSSPRAPIPNTFIVGQPKAGTTALASYLGDREDVFFSQPKELFYWNFDFPGQQKMVGLTSLKHYLQVFSAADTTRASVIGEGTTHYLMSEVAIAEIMKFNPSAKFIACIRNPVEVAQAFHGELVFTHQEDVTDFETAWRLQDRRREGRDIPRTCPSAHNLQYGDVAASASSLTRMFSLVPEQQRMVVLFDDFKRDPRSTYVHMLEFLGLPDDHRSGFPAINASHANRFPWLTKWLRQPPPRVAPFVKGTKRLIKSTTPAVLMDLAARTLTKSKQRDALRPEFHKELTEYFRDDVMATSRILGRQLDWCSRESEQCGLPEP